MLKLVWCSHFWVNGTKGESGAWEEDHVVKKGWRKRGAARVCSSLLGLAVICSRVLEQP